MKQLLRTGLFITGLLLLASVVLANNAGQLDVAPPQFIANARLDMEALADEVYGFGTRPEIWTGNLELDAQSVVADLWFDNEQLADGVYGQGQRPLDWIGATTANPEILLRNIRHDLELAADTTFGDGIRPDTWAGAAALTACSRDVMNGVYLLQTVYNIPVAADLTAPDYCASLSNAVAEAFNTAVPTDELIQELPGKILAVRGDIERLADEELGLNNRPPLWTNNKDVNSPTLAQDNYSDLETLAEAINDKEGLVAGERPPGWLGSGSATSPEAIYRNQRYDLELLADFAQGVDTRPRGWQGSAFPLLRCEPSTQGLVAAAIVNYNFAFPETTLTGTAFCQEIAFAANNVVENPPVTVIVDGEGGDGEGGQDTRYFGESQFAFSYLDLAATQYMGIMPGGTEFRAWYRNFGESTMMFVSGIDFALYIDRRWTTISEERFAELPSLEGVKPLTFCDANWCNGPAPTPTPTGSGPLLEIALGSTPPATVPAGGGGVEGKTLVSWNNIRLNYVLQRPEVGRAQVTMEICNEPAQITCEPVISVFDNKTGTAVPVISVFNNLNVYEFPYGYNNQLVIQGSTLYSTDVWLNDPALGGN